MIEYCMLYAGYVDRDDYGLIRIYENGKQKTYRLHREIYRFFVGEIKSGYVIDHLCRNRRCFNPDHLEQVTIRENMLRGKYPNPAYTDYCNKGHLLNDVGFYISGRGSKICKQCNRDRAKKRYWDNIN